MNKNLKNQLGFIFILIVLIPTVLPSSLFSVNAETGYSLGYTIFSESMELTSRLESYYVDLYFQTDPDNDEFNIIQASSTVSEIINIVIEAEEKMIELRIYVNNYCHTYTRNDLLALLNEIEENFWQLDSKVEELEIFLHRIYSRYEDEGLSTEVFSKLDDFHTSLQDIENLTIDTGDLLARFWEKYVLEFSPWYDADGDNIENYLDLEGSSSLVDYHIDEDAIRVVTEVEVPYIGINIPVKFYIIEPENELDTLNIWKWQRDHVAAEDFVFITKELKNYYIPFLVIFEFDKDIITKIPWIGFSYEFFPTNTEGIVKICATLGYLEDITMDEIVLSLLSPVMAAKVFEKATYAFPCIIDGEGKTSLIYGDELWFRFTRPVELSVENIESFMVGGFLSLASIASALTGAGISQLAIQEIFNFFTLVINDIAWDAINDLNENLGISLDNIFAVRLEDYQGDVDLAIFSNGVLVLGSDGTEIIHNSTYGIYTGDYSTELMLVNTDYLNTSEVTLDIITENSTQTENITLEWLTIEDGVILDEGKDILVVDNETNLSSNLVQYSVFPKNSNLHVIVRGEDGHLVEGAYIGMREPVRNQRVILDRGTDDSGSVVWSNIRAGNYTFTVCGAENTQYACTEIDISLAVAESKQVNVTLDLIPAYYIFSNFTSPSSITVGEEVSFSVMVTNIGGTSGLFEADMLINRTRSVPGTSVMLEPDESGLVFYERTFEKSGTYNIQIGEVTEYIIVSESEDSEGIPGFSKGPILLGITLAIFLVLSARRRSSYIRKAL